ncbi:MAG: guanylate kinase [Clostridia bacterium]|nr:guanylate kinase [Clostridia bacterium]
MRNVLMVVSGPSGVGKGTLVKRLCAEREDVVESVSCTTREPRKGEIHGREYYFISMSEFQRRIKEGDFLEYDEHFGNFYGTPISFVREQLKTRSVVLEIDVVGGKIAKEAFPECILIMIAPPSLEALKGRLISRNSETAEEIENRLSRLEYELSQASSYDYVIVNDDLETAYRDLNELIDAEKLKA